MGGRRGRALRCAVVSVEKVGFGGWKSYGIASLAVIESSSPSSRYRQRLKIQSTPRVGESSSQVVGSQVAYTRRGTSIIIPSRSKKKSISPNAIRPAGTDDPFSDVR